MQTEVKKIIVECLCHEDDVKEVKCLDCDDNGYISYSAYQSGGEIIDEGSYPCQCTLK